MPGNAWLSVLSLKPDEGVVVRHPQDDISANQFRIGNTCNSEFSLLDSVDRQHMAKNASSGHAVPVQCPGQGLHMLGCDLCP